MKISKFFNLFEDSLLKISIMSMLILLAIQVVLRYLLNISLAWIEEVSRYGFIWFCYLGVSSAAKERGHIRIVTHLELLFGKKGQSYLTLVADILWICFNIIMLFFQIRFVILMLTSRPYYSSVLGLNRGYIYMIIPFSFILLTFRIFFYHWHHLYRRQDNK